MQWTLKIPQKRSVLGHRSSRSKVSCWVLLWLLLFSNLFHLFPWCGQFLCLYFNRNLYSFLIFTGNMLWLSSSLPICLCLWENFVHALLRPTFLSLLRKTVIIFKSFGTVWALSAVEFIRCCVCYVFMGCR